MSRWQRGFLALLLACPGCWSVDRADLAAIGARHGLSLTEAERDSDSMEPLASLSVAKGGFYVLGLIPMVRVELEEAVEELALQAKNLGAEGICDIRYTLSPANPMKFLVFPIPDWSASVQVLGMAYRTRTPRDASGPR